MMEYEDIIKSCIAQKKQMTIEREEIEKFHDKIIDKEKMLDSLCIPNVSISSWKNFFDTMITENKLIDISLENVQNGASFFVGKVKVVGKNHLELLEIDGLGIYKKEVTKIFYSDITLVSFGNRYSEFLNKYS